MDKERICLNALGTIFCYETAGALNLIQACGSAAQVFAAPANDLREMAGPAGMKYVEQIGPAALEASEALLEKMEGTAVRYITIEDDVYPALLRECPDPPLGLYVKSSDTSGNIFTDRPFISVVGTRDASSYGREWCSKIVSAMAGCPRRPVIVSGLAMGVDITAHLAALENGLPTIAVMATGIDEVYPFRHGRYADAICSAPGSALLSDYPPHTSPTAIHFLRRNRIIAGLCSATLLIESRIRGGGMNTSKIAFGYDRDVYALPGRIDDIRSGGCNLLIRSKIAEPITDVEELMERLGLGRSGNLKKTDLEAVVRTAFADSPQLETLLSLALLVKKRRSITAEDISYETGLPYHQVLALTALLETGGIIATDLLGNCTIDVHYC